MIVDANILMYAADQTSRFDEAAAKWLSRQLNGPTRVRLPWQCPTAFQRIMTRTRGDSQPLTALAIEHRVPVASVDTDFARFTEVRWINPLAVS